MSKIDEAIKDIYREERLANRDNPVSRVNPLFKLILTIVYIGVLVSFHKYDIFGLLGMVIYIFMVYMLADIPFGKALYRLRIVLPIVCLVGIANPFFDKTVVTIYGISIQGGILSMITLMIKGILSVLSCYALISTTTMDKLCMSLRMIHVPKVMITQLMLMERYIIILMQETNRITLAYSLRAPKEKGVRFKVWGSLLGELLLRSIDRANDVYESMELRGFDGSYSFTKMKPRVYDYIYLLAWILIFVLIRMVPIILVIGDFVSGFIT